MAEVTLSPQQLASALNRRINNMPTPFTANSAVTGVVTTVSQSTVPNQLSGSGLTPGSFTNNPADNNLIQIRYKNNELVNQALFFGPYTAFLNYQVLKKFVDSSGGDILSTADIVIANERHNFLLQNNNGLGYLGVKLKNVAWNNALVAKPTVDGEFIDMMTIPANNTLPVVTRFDPSILVDPSSFQPNIVNIEDSMVFNMGSDNMFIISVRPGWSVSTNLYWNTK